MPGAPTFTDLTLVNNVGRAVGITELKAALDALGSTRTSYAYVREQQNAGVAPNPANSTAGSFQTRTLNTEVLDTDGILSLSANQMTLSAGTYNCRARAPVGAVAFHKLRLYNVTDSAIVLIGGSFYNSVSVIADGTVTGQFTIAAGKALELQYQCTNGAAALGLSTSFGTEVYAEIEFWKVG